MIISRTKEHNTRRIKRRKLWHDHCPESETCEDILPRHLSGRFGPKEEEEEKTFLFTKKQNNCFLLFLSLSFSYWGLLIISCLQQITMIFWVGASVTRPDISLAKEGLRNWGFWGFCQLPLFRLDVFYFFIATRHHSPDPSFSHWLLHDWS